MSARNSGSGRKIAIPDLARFLSGPGRFSKRIFDKGKYRPRVHGWQCGGPESAAKVAYYQYDHDPSLRAAILFGHGENFSRGIDVEGFKSLAGTGKPWIASTGTIDPLAKRGPNLTKPLIVVTHGDTWNMAHELFLVADIRIASADTRFGQDENTHGRFPGGGSTVRFVPIKSMRPTGLIAFQPYEGASYAICRSVYQRKAVR